MGEWREPFRKGVLYDLDPADQRVRGVLLGNVWDPVEHAHTLLGQRRPSHSSDLKIR